MTDKSAGKKILVFNVNWLGDVLFSTATIRNIKYNFPNSFIACVIPSRCYSVLKDNPYLDEIIIFDEKDRHKGILQKLDFVRSLKSRKFDIAFLLHRSFSRALICRLADIPKRIGHDTKKRGFLLTQKITPPERDSLHRVDYYLSVIEKAGLKVEDRFTDFFINEADVKFVEDFLNEKSINYSDFLVGINPGGNWGPKRWPKEHWARLADMLISKLGSKVIITGAYFDNVLAKEIQSLMKEKLINACGVFNLKQLGALCKRLNLFVTADTGPLHIANSVKTKKIVALFGPTSPKITGPLPRDNVVILQKNVGCSIPCYIVKCPDNRCMKAIAPEEVFEQIRLLK